MLHKGSQVGGKRINMLVHCMVQQLILVALLGNATDESVYTFGGQVVHVCLGGIFGAGNGV